MAKVRCISEDILNNDNFMSLPNSAKMLYVYANQATDNLGFIDSMSVAMGNAKAKQKDLQLLIDREYIIQVKDWLYLEVHFRLNNKNLRPERGAKSRFSKYIDDFTVDEASGMYLRKNAENCRQIGGKMTENCGVLAQQNKVKENKVKESKSISFNTKKEIDDFLRGGC